MDFVFHDGGRMAAGYKGMTRDCVTRSIAIATGKPYQEVYDALNRLALTERIGRRKRKLSNSRTGVFRRTYQRYLESLGYNSPDIRQQIREELNLTASTGVAPNKFLAKIASDWRKPDGLFVIQPADVEGFLTPLPVGRIPGVGKVTEEKLSKVGLRTVGEVRARSLEELRALLGRYGQRLYELAHGIDNNLVKPNRPTQYISAEDTFETDVLLTDTDPMIRRLAEKTWAASRKETRIGRTVVLKLKTAEFQTLTRSQTPLSPPASCEELTQIALSLLERVSLSPTQRFRLVGVGLGNFHDPEDQAEQSLFD